MPKQNSILDVLVICVKWRKAIFWQVAVVCLIALVLCMTVPEWYKSEAKIIPPTEEGGPSFLSSLISQIPMPTSFLGLAGASNTASLSMAILQSRTMMESVVNRFDLVNRYKAKNVEKAVRRLRKRCAFNLDEEGTISISVKDPTPFFHPRLATEKTKLLVRDMADFMIGQLDSINRTLLNQKARFIRQFYEKRYQENFAALQTEEEALRTFQEKFGTVALPEQTIAAIEAAAQLKADIMAKEIEIDILKQNFGTKNVNTMKAQASLESLNRQYNGLYGGNGMDKNKLLPAFQKIPSYGLEYARHIRNIKVQEILVELLLQQLEQARLEELKDTPTIQVLDSASLPIKRTSPQRALIMIATFLFSATVSGFLVVAADKIRELRSKKSSASETLHWIWDELSSDLKKIRFKRHVR